MAFSTKNMLLIIFLGSNTYITDAVSWVAYKSLKFSYVKLETVNG